MALALVVTGVAPAMAGERLAGPIPAETLRIVDGDTILVRVRVWLGQTVEIAVRIRGVDTPEMRSRCPEEAALARSARSALAEWTGTAPVILTNIEGGKYHGRVLADVATADGADLGPRLIATGHARPYAGAARLSWCAAAPPAIPASSPKRD